MALGEGGGLAGQAGEEEGAGLAGLLAGLAEVGGGALGGAAGAGGGGQQGGGGVAGEAGCWAGTFVTELGTFLESSWGLTEEGLDSYSS